MCVSLFAQGAVARGLLKSMVTVAAAAITTAGRRAAATPRETGTLRETAGTRHGTPPSREGMARGTAETTATEVRGGLVKQGPGSVWGVGFCNRRRSLCCVM